MEIVELDNNYGGIVLSNNNKKVLKFIFPLLTNNEKEKKRMEIKEKHPDYNESRITGHVRVSASEMEERIVDYKVDFIVFERSNEDKPTYGNRIMSVPGYGEVEDVADKIYNDFNISIHSEMSWREQAWLASAYYELGFQDKSSELRDFIKQYGVDGLRVFLSAEANLANAEKILKIGQKIESPTVNRIFARYCEIIDFIETKTIEISEQFREKDIKISAQEEKIIHLHLLGKANQFVDNLAKKISAKEKINEDELLAELDNYKADLVFIAGIWKSLKKSGIKFEDLKGVDFKRETVRDLTFDDQALDAQADTVHYDKQGNPFIAANNTGALPNREEIEQRAQEIAEMSVMYKKNYQKPEHQVLQDKLIKSFENRLKVGGDKSRCYRYIKNGHVLSFIFYDQVKEGLKHFNSFNAVPETESSGIGLSLLERSLEMEAEDSEIFGECNAATLISAKYIGPDYGFVATRSMPNYENARILALEIHSNFDKKNFQFHELSGEELIYEYQKINDRQDAKENDSLIQFFPANSKELEEATVEMINKRGFVLTNYKFSPDKKSVYCAFEKNI